MTTTPPRTYADLAADMLRDAAGFFRMVGRSNAALKDQMDQNADIYEQVADLLRDDPTGILEE